MRVDFFSTGLLLSYMLACNGFEIYRALVGRLMQGAYAIECGWFTPMDLQNSLLEMANVYK